MEVVDMNRVPGSQAEPNTQPNIEPNVDKQGDKPIGKQAEKRAVRGNPLPPRPGWQSGAACRSEQSELFFGPEGETRFERRRRETGAVAVCQSCPVLARCRRHALLAPELYGVWGGLTSGQRSAARRARKNRVA